MKIPYIITLSEDMDDNAKPKLKKWPDEILLFAEDQRYQKWLTDIFTLVNEGMQTAEEYVKVVSLFRHSFS